MEKTVTMNGKTARMLLSGVVAVMAGPDAAMAQSSADPQTDPMPRFDLDDTSKSVIMELEFDSRFIVRARSVEVVRERTHVRAGDPPLLSVEVRNLSGEPLEVFNAWHPLWAFEETSGGGEKRIIRAAGSGRLACPFRADAATLVVTDFAAGQEIASVDILPATHQYCRGSVLDPDCVGLANRVPVCNAGGPYVAECRGRLTDIQLDGTRSSDPDVDPIASYNWSGEFAQRAAVGEKPTVSFSGVGAHSVILQVADILGAHSMCSGSATIQDTLAPVISCNTPSTMSPNDIPITFTATVDDLCSTAPAPAITSYRCYRVKKNGKRIVKSKSCKVAVSGNSISILRSRGVNNNIEWTVEATDASGNRSTSVCRTLIVKPKESDEEEADKEE